MLPTVKRILLATDLTRESPDALKQVLGLTDSLNAELYVVHVVEPLSNDAKVTLMMFMQSEKARNEAILDRVKIAKQALDDRMERFKASLEKEHQGLLKLVAKVIVKEGYASDVILQQAKSLKCDLIVLGAHKRGPASTYVGTVAKRVQRRADVMTLLIPYLAKS